MGDVTELALGTPFYAVMGDSADECAVVLWWKGSTKKQSGGQIAGPPFRKLREGKYCDMPEYAKERAAKTDTFFHDATDLPEGSYRGWPGGGAA